jgi:hypothetical protein
MYVSPGESFQAPHTGANIDYYPYEPSQIVVATRPALSLPETQPEESAAEESTEPKAIEAAEAVSVPPAQEETSAEEATETPKQEEIENVESAISAQTHAETVATDTGKVGLARQIYAKLLVHINELGDLLK